MLMRLPSVLLALTVFGGVLVALIVTQADDLAAQKPSPSATMTPEPPIASLPRSIPTLTDADRDAVAAIVAADPSLHPLLDGRTWSITGMGVFHIAHIAELKIGGVVIVEVDPPIAGFFIIPWPRWRAEDARGHSEAVRDADGTIRPDAEQYDIEYFPLLARNITELIVSVSLERASVVGIAAYSDDNHPRQPRRTPSP